MAKRTEYYRDNKSTIALDKLVYSDNEKKRKGYEIARAAMDLITGTTVSSVDVARMLENINIHFGRWPKVPTQGLNMEIQLEEGNVSFGRDHINHYPLLDTITQGRVTDYINQPNLGSIIDYSKHAVIYKKTKQRQVVIDFLREQYIQPLIQQITQQVDVQSKTTDPTKLNEEALQDRQSTINNMVEQNIDPDVKTMLEKTETLSEKLFNKLLDIVLKRNKFKYKWESGAHYCEATGKEIYRIRYGLNNIYIDNVSPLTCNYQLKTLSDYIQDGLHASITTYLSPIEIITDYYHIFKNKDWKELEAMLSPIPDYQYNTGRDVSYRHTNTAVNRNFMIKIPVRPGTGQITDTEEFVPYQLDGRQGHYWAENVLDKLNDAYFNRQLGFEMKFGSWRWLAKAKKITRVHNDKVIQVIRGEHYRLDKSNGDLKEQSVAIPQTYKCSNVHDIYFDIGPEEYQYKDPHDLSKPKLSIYGCEYNSFQGHIKNLSSLEKGKPFQLRYNHLADTFYDRIANDLGTVLYAREDAISSDKVNPFETLSTLHKFKVLIGRKSSLGKDPGSDGGVRALELGDRRSKMEMIQVLEYIESKMQGSMGTNKAKVDSPGQYTNTANLNNQINNVERQQYRIISMRSQLREDLYNGLMKSAFFAYQDNYEVKESYLSDDELAHYELNFDEIIGSPIYYECKDGFKDTQNLSLYKQYLLNYAATNGNLVDLAESINAETMDEAITVAKRSEMQVQKRQEQQLARAEALQQAAEQSRREEILIKEKGQNDRKDKEVEVRKESALLHSLTLANANDINEDGVADHIERHADDRKLKEKIHEDEMKLKERELDIKEQKSKG
jgi:hypothetical protein